MQNSAASITSFADDTVLFYKAKSWMILKVLIENDLGSIIDWFNSKLLTINFKKTMFLPVSCNKSTLPDFDKLIINNHGNIIEILTTEKVKYLGVTLDSFLRWNFHGLNIVSVLRTIIFKFKYLRNILDLPQIKILYYALVESRLSYGILGWGGISSTYLKNIETIQKRFLKIMLKKEHTYPSNLLYLETEILDPRQIFYVKILHYNFKHSYIFKPLQNIHQTRNKTKENVKTIKAQKTIGQRSCAYLGPRLYNKLPQNLKQIKSFPKFKKELKKHVLKIERSQIHSLIDIKNN